MNITQNFLMTKNLPNSAYYRLPFAARVVSISASFQEGNINVAGVIAIVLGDAPGFQCALTLVYVPTATQSNVAAIAGGCDDFRTIATNANSVHVCLPDQALPPNCLVQIATEAGSAWDNEVYINIEPA